MADLIKVKDSRQQGTSRTLQIGDIIISPKISSSLNPYMLVGVGSSVGLFDIKAATIVYTGSTIYDVITYYGIKTLDDIKSIVPYIDVTVNMDGETDDGNYIALPTMESSNVSDSTTIKVNS